MDIVSSFFGAHFSQHGSVSYISILFFCLSSFCLPLAYSLPPPPNQTESQLTEFLVCFNESLFSLNSYYRARWIYALEIIAAYAGHVVMAFIFRPSEHNATFPFAFKTAAMEAKDRWTAAQAERQGGGAGGRRGREDEKSSIDTSEDGTRSFPMTRRPRDSSVTEGSYGLTTSAASGGSEHVGGISGGGGGARRRRSSAGQGNISGGLALDTPVVRVRSLATSLRKKLGVVYEVADQLEEELSYLDDVEEEEGALIQGGAEEKIER